MPQTQNSYALRKGWVAVFDFRTADREEIEQEVMKWSGYFWGRPYRIGFSIDVAKLEDDLILWEAAKADPEPSMWIPYFEAWSRHPIDISAVNGVTVTSYGMVFSRPIAGPIDPNRLAAEVSGIGQTIASEFERHSENKQFLDALTRKGAHGG